MKVLILAGGFAKRMWPLTENQAKALLPVAGKPVIEHILEKLEPVPAIGEVHVSTNRRFEDAFARWIAGVRTSKLLSLVVEPHDREEQKMGAIGGLKYFIDTCAVDEDLLVIAGDNLFEFDVNDLLKFGEKTSGPVVALYDIADVDKVRGRFGVAVVDEEGTIVAFEEKPAEPRSTLISAGIYLFERADLRLVHEYLGDAGNPDAPGFFIRWLTGKRAVKGFVFDGRWYDIGSFKLYADANAAFRRGTARWPGWRLRTHDVQ
ncbi:MAG: nucleotidyltransferase family protein [Candidatus Lokiarchaeota archaeon]|nr:nucleotidyltransferase family protein [Candidatus Lokiarchaeota archaeon]